MISSCSLRNETSLISDNVYHFDLRPTYIASLGIVKKGFRENPCNSHQTLENAFEIAGQFSEGSDVLRGKRIPSRAAKEPKERPRPRRGG